MNCSHFIEFVGGGDSEKAISCFWRARQTVNHLMNSIDDQRNNWFIDDWLRIDEVNWEFNGMNRIIQTQLYRIENVSNLLVVGRLLGRCINLSCARSNVKYFNWIQFEMEPRKMEPETSKPKIFHGQFFALGGMKLANQKPKIFF